jgi:hypothetical protein
VARPCCESPVTSQHRAAWPARYGLNRTRHFLSWAAGHQTRRRWPARTRYESPPVLGTDGVRADLDGSTVWYCSPGLPPWSRISWVAGADTACPERSVPRSRRKRARQRAPQNQDTIIETAVPTPSHHPTFSLQRENVCCATGLGTSPDWQAPRGADTGTGTCPARVIDNEAWIHGMTYLTLSHRPSNARDFQGIDSRTRVRLCARHRTRCGPMFAALWLSGGERCPRHVTKPCHPTG